MARRRATVPIETTSKPSQYSLAELLPPMSPEDEELHRADMRAIEASESAAWLMLQQELDDGPPLA